MKKRVAVLRGGPSTEHEVSLKTGTSVIKNLPEKYEAIDIYIDTDGVWHLRGIPMNPQDINKIADVVFVAMHGHYGEDGTVQKLLEQIGIPFTGSKSLASAIGMNKALAKDFFKKKGIKTPYHKVYKKSDYTSELATEIFKTFPQPSVIKPNKGGSSIGVSIVYRIPEIEEGLRKAFESSDEIIIEECIKGKEATCGVLENFRDKEHYPLLTVEIVPKSHQKFFDHESKYSNESGADEICPGNFTREETEEIQRLAVLAHQAVGANHYSRTDFMVHPKRGVFALEINTLPGLTEASLLPKEIKAIGSSYSELLEHLVELALAGK